MASRKLLGAAGIAGALSAGVIAGALIGTPMLSGAQDSGSSSTTQTAPVAPVAPVTPATPTAPANPTAPSPSQHPAPPPGTFDPKKGGHVANGVTESLLTGDTATKVSAAAQAAVPDATIDRVENDAEGSPYEAHMTKADGSHVTVKVDANFTVSTIETDQMGPH